MARRCTRSARRRRSAPAAASGRVLDGRFAESKEVVAGYFIIEAEDRNAAVEIASRCPNAEFGSVEVREIVSMG